jgi:hypothetical protein
LAAGLGGGLAAGPGGGPLAGLPLVHLEDLYLGWSGLDGGFARLVELVLEPWARGRAASFRAYDWRAGAPTGRLVRVAAGPCLVVEGCGCAPRPAEAFNPVIIWMDAPRPVRFERVLARDGAWEAPYLERWERDTAAHFARQRTAARADIRLIAA